MPSSLEPFSGCETFRAPLERVFAVLSDPAALASAMPGLASSEPDPADPRTRRCVVRPKFSFLAGSIKIGVTVAEAQPPERVAVRVAVQGIGLSMEINSDMRLAAVSADETQVSWKAEVGEMKGLIKAAPAGLVKGAAESVIKDGWASLRKIAESPKA